MPTTGKTLRRLRRSREVTTVALALQMHVSRQTLWALERAGEVTQDRVEQYRAALDVIVASRNPEQAA